MHYLDVKALKLCFAKEQIHTSQNIREL